VFAYTPIQVHTHTHNGDDTRPRPQHVMWGCGTTPTFLPWRRQPTVNSPSQLYVFAWTVPTFKCGTPMWHNAKSIPSATGCMAKCYQPAGTARFVQITRLSRHGKMKTLPWIMCVSIHCHTGLNRNDPILQRRRCSYITTNVNTLHKQLWAIFLFRDEDSIQTFSPYPDKFSVNSNDPPHPTLK